MTATAILANVSTVGATKHCPCCNNLLGVSQFHKNRRSKDGLQGFCIACAKTSRKKPDKIRIEKTRALKHAAHVSGSKQCSICLVFKPMNGENWAISPRGLGGYDSKCKSCSKKARDAKKSPELVKKQNEIHELSKAGMKRCPGCKEAKEFSFFIQRKTGGYYSYCLECCKKQSNQKRLSDVDKDREKKLKSWRKRIVENGDAMRTVRNEHRSEKRKTDPLFAMSERVRGHLGSSFRRLGYTKRSRTYEILGCDWAFFKTFIERQFLKGMTWENRSEWHLDHIVPMATAKTEEDVIALNHFTNLRPMWAKDNIKKSAHITHLI